MRALNSYILFLLLASCISSVIAQDRLRTIRVYTEPNSTVWIDNVKRGVTDESGRIEIRPIIRGSKVLRVRANGFREVLRNLAPGQHGDLKVVLVRTKIPAELAFQEAENLLSENRPKAIDFYRKAIKLRPRYPEAYLGLARALTGSNNGQALKAITNARKYRPTYPQASAVEGRIYRSLAEIDKAIESFDRAIREGNGFQPEAYTGLGMIFTTEAENSRADDDLEDEKYYYGEAAKSFEKAIDQLAATESVLYFLLGSVYEKSGDLQKAIRLYERFLRDFPTSIEGSVARSFIVQLKKEIQSQN